MSILRDFFRSEKGAYQPTPQTPIHETTTKWQLPQDTSTGLIGSFKGPLRNCYRTTVIKNSTSADSIEECITEYRCIVENSPERTIEVVLVTYPNEIEGITNCYVMWRFRDSNFQEQVDEASILIGNLNQDLLITKEEHFNCVMKELLNYTSIKGRKENPNDSSKGKYIADILYHKSGICSIGFDPTKAEKCQTNQGIVNQQKMLLELIDAHNNEMINRPDYRGPKK